MKTYSVLAVIVLLGMPQCGLAAVILSLPLDPTLVGKFSNLDPDDGQAQQIAADFEVTAPTTLTSVSWQGRYGAPLTSLTNPVAFRIRFFADDGGNLGLPLATFFDELNISTDAAPTGGSYNNAPWLSYATGLNLDLTPGTYWLSIVEDESRTGAVGVSQWVWGMSDGQFVTTAFRNSDSENWSITSANMAMALEGIVIPEPGTLALLTIAFLAIGRHVRLRMGTHTIR